MGNSPNSITRRRLHNFPRKLSLSLLELAGSSVRVLFFITLIQATARSITVLDVQQDKRNLMLRVEADYSAVHDIRYLFDVQYPVRRSLEGSAVAGCASLNTSSVAKHLLLLCTLLVAKDTNFCHRHFYNGTMQNLEQHIQLCIHRGTRTMH